ncbi:hypothetical protein EU522_00775 [Candidatus Thorarchaeota archaeon]|nr:MAG: hypothetical protein EU522_00775 [Candidatus Thorarchaeota archaeon]
MKLGTPSTRSSPGDNPKLVRGCPCYKEFGVEKVCLNNDDVLPINSISVDPGFFGQTNSIDDLAAFNSDNPSMCYLLIYLDEESGHTFCVSQGQELLINSKAVSTTEIQAALQFVLASEKASDGIVCSSCLYKYLMTLGETFEDLLSEGERAELISGYVKEFTTEMAIYLSGASSIGSEPENLEIINSRISELVKLRGECARLIQSLRDRNAETSLLKLVDAYRTLFRLEAVFLFQVVTLRESADQNVSVDLIRFMVEMAERVLYAIDEIRESTIRILEKDHMPADLKEFLNRHAEIRKSTEARFTDLIRILGEIETRSTQKGL